MNIKLSFISTSIGLSTISTAVFSLPTIAQNRQVGFYCGFTHNLEPATMIAIKGNDQGNQPIVVWRHKLGNLSPKQRCELAAQRFQAAWNRGNFNYLVSSVDNTNGQGLICAASSKRGSCEAKNILFNVENAREAQSISNRLLLNMKRPVGGTPIYESNPPAQSIDMQELIQSLTK
jgi:Circadian oscillating protein COP23